MAGSTPGGISSLGLHDLFDNPVFAGGFGLASLGAVLAVARRGSLKAAAILKQRLLVNCEISRQDPAYGMILAWLSEPRPQRSFLARRLTRIHDLTVTTTMTTSSRSSGGGGGGGGGGGFHASFFLQPGYGRHVVRYRDVYIAVKREKTSTARTTTGEPHETVTLTTLFANRHVLEHVFTEARAIAAQANEGKTVVYSVRNFDWVPLGEPRRKRPLASVILDAGLKERIVEDAKGFLRQHQWYMDRGIPYRRGYLLHGSPGTGKTSFIQALAGELNYALAMVNLSEIGVTDDKLAFLLTKLPARTILLLEDVDSAFVNRTNRSSDGYSGKTVTFSGLLNALDGVSAGEERIAFLTTNHVEALDPALIRPGRVDMMVEIGAATRHQAAQMWDRFYADIDPDGSGRERFLSKLDDLDLFGKHRTSTAAIQGLFIFNKSNIEGAISMAEGLVPSDPDAKSIS